MNAAPIAVGLIGYRGFGAFCTEAYHAAHVGQVVAYAGRDAQAMAATAQLYGVPQTYTNWRALIADPAVELVHIVTPPDQHAEMAIAALQAGKHVLIEKPLATHNEDASAILAASQAAGRVAGVNFVMRYNPLYQIVLQIARAGWLGLLTHVAFENYASDEGLGDNHWFWNPLASGGIFVEHGVHFFDMIGAIIGAPARHVLGQTWIRPDGTGKEDRVQAVVTYDNDVEASYYHAFNRPGALERQTAQFAFERGHLTLRGWIPNTLELSAVVTDEGLAGLQTVLPVEIVPDTDFPSPGREIRGNGKKLFVNHRIRATQTLPDLTSVYKSAVQDAMADLVAAIRNPHHTRLVTAQDGAVSLRVALAAKRSAECGRVATVEES